MIVNGLKILQKVRTPGNRPDNQEKTSAFCRGFAFMSMESLLSNANGYKTKSEQSERGFFFNWPPPFWMTERSEGNPVVTTKKPSMKIDGFFILIISISNYLSSHFPSNPIKSSKD